MKIQLTKFSWVFLIYIILAIGIRYIHFPDAMYFIYDVGRDAVMLRAMAEGDLKLVGPTTGLPGFFLGPLWYYVALPGYLISAGNPYGLQLWLISLAVLSIPLFWYVTHQLFGNSIWAKLAAVLLAIIPGSINGTNFVWNPMLSLPLMVGVLICFIKSRESKKVLYLGFFLLALTLQSEFAYAIFLIVTFWLLIPWIREKFEFKTMLITTLIIAATLIPQLLFELTHNFSMTKSLVKSMQDPTMKVSQQYLWENRPQQLLNASLLFFNRSQTNPQPLVITLGLIGIIGYAAAYALLKDRYPWKMVALIAIIPYIYYMFWRGNYGYFFDYYITPHFIFLTLLLVYGFSKIVSLFPFKIYKIATSLAIAGFCFQLLRYSVEHLNSVILAPRNQAGLKVMVQAVNTLFNWSQEDQSNPPVFRIYTPNVYTEHYDYLSWWLANTKGYPSALTVQSNSDTHRYILYEPPLADKKHIFFDPWYKNATEGMEQTRKETHGILNFETWQRIN